MNSYQDISLEKKNDSSKNTRPSAVLRVTASPPKTLEEKISELNFRVFKNSTFRENQKEIILSSLSGKDIFVCMPTGGGKSLTFQLPALLSEGLTLIVMPLVSLIHDQSEHLNKLNVQSRVFGSSKSKGASEKTLKEIDSDFSIKIVFITPEKISKSEKTMEFLRKLYRENRLSRFAIDEAHCVSKWGREFRVDYLKLNVLRKNFPNVPIIALTGTATEKVRKDVVSVLQMRIPSFFLASFNRKNLYYEVRQKSSKVVEEIAEYIDKKHRNQPGLIYCISKKDCEKVSKELVKYRVKSSFYHASLADKKRTEIQNEWMEGKVHVLVATVAFGMGIDKKNVRFVIHYSFPKSLENYYQESGRAGRDGLKSDCIVYFNYSDKFKHDILLAKDKRQKSNYNDLYSMMKYCEDKYMCRRKTQLEYFGENFDSRLCDGMCDNCVNKMSAVEIDYTNEAKEITKILQDTPEGINTLLQIAGFLKGKYTKKNDDLHKSRGYGKFSDMKIEEIEKILRKMVYTGVLEERSVKCSKKFKMTKVSLGDKHLQLLNGSIKIVSLEPKSEKYENKTKPEPKRINLDSIKKNKRREGSDLYYSFEEFKYSSEPSKINMKNQNNSYDFSNFVKENLSPRIPYEKSIEIVLDSPVKLSFSNDNLYLNDDQQEELKSRLEIVRKKLSKKLQKPENEVLSNFQLDFLVKTLEGNVHQDFIKEIKYFIEVNSIIKPSNLLFTPEEIKTSQTPDTTVTKKLKLNN